MDRRPVSDWASDWDYLAPDYRQRTAAIWDGLRQRCPVAHTNRFQGAWLTINFEDVGKVAHDPSSFSSRVTNLYDEMPERLVAMPPISLDPPDHGKYRRIVLPAFTPKAVAKLVSETESYCNALIDRFAQSGRADGSQDFAQHVPVFVTAKLLGVPDSDGDRFRQWVHRFVEVGPSDNDAAAGAFREMLAYFREQLAQRREDPREDVTTLVANGIVDGVLIPERVQAAMLILLLLGGVDTTWSAIGSALLHLAMHSGDQARLRAEPELLDTAIEEFLRFYAPAEIGRVATRETEIGGCPVAAGEYVWLSFPAANRDPAAFPHADQFIMDRKENRHLAFGLGIHRCLGSNLARMEMQVALRTWLQRVPSFRLQDEATIDWTSGGNILGPRRIPISF
jgi:cytochrome P450